MVLNMRIPHITDLLHGVYYAGLGFTIVLPLQEGKHFINHDDDERPWFEWDRDMLEWLRTNEGSWANLGARFTETRYIVFKDSKTAIKWKLIWG